ncbi:uncharacterized protein OCT59_006119 [Rhizophagus irregularis]|uniref:uncharacterized protein n=1 Tax=Rhizophagus irregularis TaxID=588596 RepID=UPI000CB0BCDD|nr:hypothetical protein OCT59_006119 [Rhizophagus irregularis]GBC38420.1 translation initiation factor IF-2 [Rhizophagus irregularis DAOM 181602=DAOM 197198]CAG8521272.1 8293_t:CDS:1 [Rhizophagus irregularis]
MGNLFSSSTKSTSTSNSNSKSSSTSNSSSKSTPTSNSSSKSTPTSNSSSKSTPTSNSRSKSTPASNGSNDGLNDNSSDDNSSDDNSSDDSSSDDNSSDDNSSDDSSSDYSFISWYMKIKDKLKDEEIYNSLGKKKLNELIFSLGDETKFLDQHLKLFYDDDHLNKINRDLRRLDRLQGNNFIPSEEDGRDLVNGLLQRRREADKFNVYLFIEKLSDNRSDSSFLRFLANYVFKNKYGMFHVGLEIDGIVLEWGTGDAGPHLIYPRINTNKIYEKIAHIRINYDSNFSQEFNHSTNTFLQDWQHYMQNLFSTIINFMRMLLYFVLKIGVVPSNKLQIIAQKCVYWNRNYYYDPLNRNCQHFINEILETLNLKFNPKGEFKKFLDRIVQYADDRYLFQRREFLSRQDLDQFADQNWNMITNSWDKRLLLCYSDMMNNMYEYKYDEKWGPMNNKEKWIEREYELRTD